ncbi:MAG: protogloblin ApPgb [Bryobacteraceae bacterium]|nr:protogloblin ApPgb [Bryobacteraceae bacterium]
MNGTAEDIPGYSYGRAEVARSSISETHLAQLKISAGFTDQDERYLRLAGEILRNQTEQIVHHWRNQIIAGIPNLARHSRTAEGEPIPAYLEKSNARFRQWILDTCLRPWDQDWIDYQQEIALRHTSVRKNQVDGVRSSDHVPLRDVMAFIGVMNETMKDYLANHGSSSEEVEKMHSAWCKAMQVQLALWVGPYTDKRREPEEW